MAPLWPFPTKSASQSRRIDQGWDLQYPGKIPVPVLAVESGHLANGGPDPAGFGPGYPVLHLDKPGPGGPSVYYGHTFTNKLLVGDHVPKGTPIGLTGGAHSGGNAYADSNWLEIGFWDNGPIGNGAAMQSWLTGASAGSGSGTWYVVNEPLSQRLGVDHKVVIQAPVPGNATILAGPFQTKAEATSALQGLIQHGTFPNPLSGLSSIGHFFDNLSQRQFWVRVAEVTLGGLLIAIALNKMFDISGGIERTVGVASSVASKVPIK